MRDRTLRSLLIALVCGAAAGLAVALIAVALDFGVSVALWIFAGILIATIWWGALHVVPDGEQDAGGEPVPQHPPRSAGLDRRTRLLETRLRGAQWGHATTPSALHATINEIVANHPDQTPLPPHLRAYLDAEPRPLSRAHLRTILRELSTL